MSKDRLFLGYETAFWIWRKAGPLAFSALAPSRVRSLAGGAPSTGKIKAFRSEHPDLALDSVDVLVGRNDLRNTAGVNNHVITKPLPDRSFYRMEEDVYVASPELCLLQLARKLTEAQVLKLAMEMCGTYALDMSALNSGGLFDAGDEEENGAMCKRPPLTTASRLNAYARRMYTPESRARSVHFLRYVVDGSASPRETALFTLLCMPPRFGGYGLALPELNRRIEFTPTEQLKMGVRYFDCDLYWPKKRIAVEYDSKLHHTAQEKQERDAIRRNILLYKGVRVIVATRKQVNSEREFDKLARQIGRATGKRFRTPEKEHIAARQTLRNVLFDWDALPTIADDSRL